MALQTFQRHALHIGAQCGGDACGQCLALGPLRQHAPRPVRCHAAAGGPQPGAEHLLGAPAHRRAIGLGALLQAGHRLQHAARALPDHAGRGIGAANQRRGNRRLLCIQPVRGLAKQRAAQGIQPDQLAAKRHQVQVGLQNFILAPTAFQARRGHRLPQLLAQAAPARGNAPIPIQQPGQLHGDGAGTARFLVPQIAPGRRRHRLPVHPAVRVKALVLAGNQRQTQRGRHI